MGDNVISATSFQKDETKYTQQNAATPNDGDSDAGPTDSLIRLLDANIFSSSPTLYIATPSKREVLVASTPPLQEMQVISEAVQPTASSSSVPDPSEIRQLPPSTPTKPKAMEYYEKRNSSAMAGNCTPQKDFRARSSTPKVLTHKMKKDEPKKRELRARSPSPLAGRRNTGQSYLSARPRFGKGDYWSPPQGNSFFSPPPRRPSTPRPLFPYDPSVPLPSRRESTATIPEKKLGVQSPPEKMNIPQAAVGAAASAAPKHPSLALVAIQQGEKTLEDVTCFNCTRKGHVFMDCTFGCGKCGNDGHRTIDCLILHKL